MDDDNKCRECGDEYSDGGDGWDGMCPSCADVQTFTILVGMDCRVYGTIDIKATSAERAAEQLADTEAVYDQFVINRGSGDIETINGRNLSIIHTTDENGEIEMIETDLPDDECGLPYLSVDDATLIANALSDVVGNSLEPEFSKQAERIMLSLTEQIEHVTKRNARSGFTCPKCKQTDGMNIVADIWVHATKNKADPLFPGLPNHDAFWNENNGCRCPKCDWHGNVSDVS